MTDRPLTSVMEDYLEAIFDLDRERKTVRVKDIARRMNVKMPTVTSMLKNLNDRGLVNYGIENLFDDAIVSSAVGFSSTAALSYGLLSLG